jgi:hypothetical protein
LEVISITGRGWELPPESSPLEKELEKLKRENAELKRVGPSISCELQARGVKLDVVRLKAESFPPLSTEDVDELVNAVRVVHPEATEFDKASFGERPFSRQIEWTLPTPEAIEAYRQSYSQWIADLKTFVADTQLRLTRRAVSVELELIICNDGVEPADDVTVSIETVGGFLLWQIEPEEGVAEPTDNAPAQLERYRGPPTPPGPIGKITLPQMGAWPNANRCDAFAAARALSAPNPFMNSLENLADRYQGLAMRGTITPIIPASLFPPIHQPRDRHKFYLRDTGESDGVTRWQFECAEFQHRVEPTPLSLRLIADFEDGRAHSGTLEVKLSARNLRTPFVCPFPIQFDVTEGDTISRIRALMPSASRRLRSCSAGQD